MTSGGWHSQEHRHGRHRQGVPGGAWTPAVRPTDTGPAHARRDALVPFMRPADHGPGWPVNDVLTRRAGWPEDPVVPLARQSAETAWPTHDEERPEVPVALRRPRHAAPPRRRTISSDMVLDTVPMGTVRVGRHEAVVYGVPETPATGLRTFDLGNVPASVTPPRSWRRAAWFAVGTSAAVALGLTVAAVELMGRPVSDSGLIDALPAYPSGPLTHEKLPNELTTTPFTPHPGPTTSSPDKPHPSSGAPESPPPMDTVIDGTTGYPQSGTSSPDDLPSAGGSTDDGTATTAKAPNRTTVGPAPVTPTDPQAMGDRTEQYFALVASDPAAAHAMTTGGMAREGEEGIQARYAGVRRIEVQDITIDRGQAVTTSTVKIIREDGSEVIEHRQLTFTWGGDPKITGDSITG